MVKCFKYIEDILLFPRGSPLAESKSYADIFSWKWEEYYNKDKWVSDHSVEIMWIVFVSGYFTCMKDMKYPYQNNSHDLHRCHHKVVLVFMPYYYWFDIDFNGLCVQF